MDPEQFAELLTHIDNLQPSEDLIPLLELILETQRSIYCQIAVCAGMVLAGFLLTVLFLCIRSR